MEIKDAVEFMKEKHKGQTRKQGTPYYTHPLEVSDILKKKGFSEKYQIVGLFHDLLEDTNTTFEEIEKMTDSEIANAVQLLTKENGYIMEEYIGKINKNEIAKNVKLADRLHNLSEMHFATKEFQKKYIKETEKWFIILAKNTIFEKEINEILQQAKEKYTKNKDGKHLVKAKC